MLEIATVIFWVFLAAFVGLAAYSIKDLGLDIGETQVSTTPNGELLFSLPVFIDNKGYSSLNDLQITTIFFDDSSVEISKASTSVASILPGETTLITHNTTLNVNALLHKGEQYLLEDQNLAASVATGLTLAELLPVQISTNFTYKWGAPFYDFRLSQPSVDGFNITHYKIIVPVSFENHAVFDLSGSMRIQLFGNDNRLLSDIQRDFNAPRQTLHADEVEFLISLGSESLLNRNGYFNVYLYTELFEYGPLVIPYG